MRYTDLVLRADRQLDAHLGRIFPVLMKVAIRGDEAEALEAKNALIGLVRARAVLKSLRLAPVRIDKPIVAPWLVGLDCVIQQTLQGQHVRPIEPRQDDD